MYKGGIIIAGLAVFVLLVTFPFWFGVASGSSPPDPVAPEEGSCVKDAEWMAAWHMDLLDDWRDAVVRDGDREPVMIDGKPYKKSLTLTCMECHDNKDEFCDACHDYAGVDPFCWDCHIEPEGQP